MNYKITRPGGYIASIFVDESAKLGRGATANVYRVHFDDKDFAAKIYHDSKLFDRDKIRAMLESPPDGFELIQNGQEYPQFAWPLFIITDNANNEIGFLMPLVDTHESFTLDHYYDLGLFKKLRSHDESALSYKLEIAKNLSRLVANLHNHGHFFIDCKPQNIRVFKRNHVVTLIDCDGFSINGKKRRFPAELLSTDYIAPEVQRNNILPAKLDEYQDRYALAVIFFQLLNRGTHPFQGLITDSNISLNTNDEKAAAGLYPYGIVPNPRIKPRPQSTHQLWREETRVLFDQAFANSSPAARPSAREWADHFEKLLATKTLVRCERFPNDVEHIRFRDLDCSACYLKALPQFTLPPQTPKPAQRATPRNASSAPQPLHSTYIPPPASKSSSNLGWWAFFGALVFVLIWAQSSNNKPTSSAASTVNTPSANTTAANSQLAPPSSYKYISLYASSTSRAVGYSLAYDTGTLVDTRALSRCVYETKGNPEDQCVKIVSSAGQCLAISRASNGAMGVHIGSSAASAAVEAQGLCKRWGGDECSTPTLTSTMFCQTDDGGLPSLQNIIPATVVPASVEADQKFVALLRSIQVELIRLGHAGTPDGIYGPITAEAIRQRQQKYSDPVDGQPSEQLLSKLRQDQSVIQKINDSNSPPSCADNKTTSPYSSRCIGTYTLPDGDKYVGNFENGRRMGQGTYTWPNGNKYVGNWENDRRMGQGTFTWLNGNKFVGNFKDGKFDGQGTYTWPDGTTKSGRWQNDEFQGP